MSFDIWLTEPPVYGSVGIVPPAFRGGHVLRLAYCEGNQFMFSVDRYFDEAGALMKSKLHRFNTVFDRAVGISHAEVESVDVDNQYIDVVIAGSTLVVLRQDTSGETPRYFLEKRDPYTMNTVDTLEVFSCKLTSTGGPSVWLVSASGIMKRLNVDSMLFEAEKSYPSNTECDRGVYDPVMDVLIVPKKLENAALYDATSGDAISTVAFPWQGPNQFAYVAVPPHGESGGYNPPIVAMTEYDSGLKKAKLTLFQRDISNRTYLPMLVDIPFCTDAIAPHGQIEGFYGMTAAYVTIDNQPPGTDAEVAIDSAKLAKRLVFTARNGSAPSAGQTPLAYFVGRRVDLENYMTAPMFSAGLPECNPFKRHMIPTHGTARLWLASVSLDGEEQKAYPACTLAI